MAAPELVALEREAAEADQALGVEADREAPAQEERPAGEGGQVPAPAPDQVQAVAQALELAVAVLGPMFPSLREVYTPETIRSVAEVTGALARKHGWDLSLGRWQEEIAFLAVVVPVGARTYQAVLRDLEARRQGGRQGDQVDTAAGDGAVGGAGWLDPADEKVGGTD